ncbi:MAG: hypothetical protein KatS3mg097_544 [Candidatus Parcubacteria bacterium]|nr:MAG: hypothetical protein KatS3mg097_544 [Candidatus Parcubacteria bacterium]
MIKNLVEKIKNGIKEQLKSGNGYRLFEKLPDDIYYFPIYPKELKEIKLREDQVDYIIDYLTSNFFLEKCGFDLDYEIKEIGGELSHTEKFFRKKEETEYVDEKIGDAVGVIRNYLKNNENEVVSLFKKAATLDKFEIIQEKLLLYFDGYLSYWDFNNLDNFKKEVAKFRKKYKINVQDFLNLRKKIEEKYKKLDENFSLEKVFRDYRFWTLEILEKKINELNNNQKLKNAGKIRNILEIPLSETFVYIDNLTNFNILKGQQINTEDVYGYLALLEVSYKENRIVPYKIITKNFIEKFKIPDIYGSLLKNYVFYDEFNPDDWRLYMRERIKNKKVFKDEKTYTKRVLCYLLTENNEFRKRLKTILEIKNSKEYELRHTIRLFMRFNSLIKNGKKEIKELKKQSQLINYVKSGIVKVNPPIHTRNQQEIRTRQRHLNKNRQELKDLKSKILSEFQSIKEAIIFVEKFESNYSDVFADQNMTPFEGEKIHLLWMLADALDDLPQLKEIILKILEKSQKSWRALNELCSLLKLGSVNKEDYRDFIKAVKSF